jgi:hypothetical protein
MTMRTIGSVDAADKVWGIQQYLAAMDEGKKYGAGYALQQDLLGREQDYDVVIAPRNYVNGAALFDGQMGGDAAVIWGHIKGSGSLQGILPERGKISATPLLDRPLVFWNPKMTIKMIGDQNGIAENALDVVKVHRDNAGKGLYVRTRQKGPLFITKRVVVYTRTDLPPWAVLYHELGHIRQSFEKGSDAAFLAYAQNTMEMEKDNLSRVEHPLCAQAKLAKRASYLHLEMSIPFTGNLKNQAIDAHSVDFPLVYIANNKGERDAIDTALATEARANIGKDPTKSAGLFYNVL